MLAMVVAGFLGFLALVIALCSGEVRYEQPHRYPMNQQFGAALAIILLVLALCTARYL